MFINRRKFAKLTTLGIAMTNFSLFYHSNLGDKWMNRSYENLLKIGIIGTGSRGTWLAEIIGRIPNMKLVACCDILKSNLEKGLNLAGKEAIGYNDYRKLLENTNI